MKTFGLFSLKSLIAVALVSSVTLLTGCGEAGPEGAFTLVPVKGRVLMGTVPVADAQISFHIDGAAPEGYMGSAAKTNSDGEFELTVGPRRGAVPGKYKVTVSKLTRADGTPLPADATNGMDAMQLKMQGQVIESIPANFSQLPYTQLAYDVPASTGGNFEIVISQ